ncbi:VOC family protein [Oceanomicrobium pacificus]|uniref:VOC family protein n=1 Tax=Oceanomicrobium pacificus TaxID=2692916 RepID=A0A6B0U717_9RHOB|nr:VOC family protein [Oceanomicrobium pacificus]MXU66651.1 VOC family protein [Oceanomicrobium pacificus]
MTQTPITGIGHVALKVADLDRTLAFYRDRLGFPEMLRLHKDDGSVWLVYLRITDTQYLEIFPGAEGDTGPGPDANAVHHICWTVEDLDATCRWLEEQGVVLTIPPQLGLDGNRQAWLADPDGHRIELMEMAADSLQARAIARLAGSGPEGAQSSSNDR